MSVYKQPKSKYWYYRFVWNGEEIRRSTKQTNKRVAEQMEAAHKTSLAKGEVGIRERKPCPTFSALCKKFLNWIAVEKEGRPSTVKFYNDMVRSLLRYDPFVNLPLDRIDKPTVEEFVKWRRGREQVVVLRRTGGKAASKVTGKPVSISTINRELATLRRMLNLAHDEWSLLPSTPPKIRLLPGEKNRERILSQPEEEMYLGLAPDPLHDFAIICIDTGMRPGEIQRIRWENVHFKPVGDAKHGYIHNPEGGPKKRRRNLPMTARVREVLFARHRDAGSPKEGWVFTSDDRQSFVAYSKIDSQHDRTIARMNLSTPFRLYDLRHTALTRYGECGTDVFALQQIAGHTDIKTTSRYVHPTPEHIERSVSRLEQYNREKAAESARGMKVQ